MSLFTSVNSVWFLSNKSFKAIFAIFFELFKMFQLPVLYNTWRRLPVLSYANQFSHFSYRNQLTIWQNQLIKEHLVPFSKASQSASTHLMPLVSLYAPRKHQNHHLIFSAGIERNQTHEMGQWHIWRYRKIEWSNFRFKPFMYNNEW